MLPCFPPPPITMENPNNPKETEKPETDPSSPSPPPAETAAAAEAESPPSSPRPPPPPPSLSSSPSHEFSFTISFHAPNSLSGTTSAAAAAAVKLSKSSLSPLDLDLSPADDIFFNGHLLPLHFVSHRSSDVSIQNNNFFPHSHIETDSVDTSNTAAATTGVSTTDYKGRSSSKSFPLVWLRKWLKGNDGEENRGGEKQRKKSIKKVFDFAQLWKKYASLVEQLIFLKDWRDKREIRRSTQFPFSGHRRHRRWQGGQSAPASIQTSPANSGLLVTPPANNFSSEELQNAIQAAIVHCKKSIAVKGDNDLVNHVLNA